jgi:hypothetical protein
MSTRARLTLVGILLVTACTPAAPSQTGTGGSPTVAPTAQPTPPPTATATATATASPTLSADLGRRWERIATGFRSARLEAVVAGGPGLIAGGSIITGRRLDGVIWTSADGRAWRRVTAAPGFQDAGVGNLAAKGDGALLAIGATCALESECGGPRVWTSSDGSTWAAARTNLPQNASLASAAAGGPGWVAVGSVGDFSQSRPAVWTSTDGTRWTAARGFGSAEGYLSGIVVTSAGFVAHGSAGTIESRAAAVWVSADGSAWERVPQRSAPAGTEVTAAASIGDLLVAVSRSIPATGNSRGWTSSDDGRSWRELPAGMFRVAGVNNVYVTTLVEGGPGLIAFGDADLQAGSSTVAVWVTTNGTTWQEGEPAAFSRARVRDGAVLAGTAVAVGEALCSTQCPAQGLVWGSPPR